MPPMAVKLNGDMEATKPSMPRYLMLFFVTFGFSEIGLYLVASFKKKALILLKMETEFVCKLEKRAHSPEKVYQLGS